jgi:hypothetical protein
MDETPGRAFYADRFEERLLHQVRSDPRSQCAADDLSVEEVFAGGAVKPAFIGGYVGQIADPDLIRRRRCKVLFEEVLGNGKRMVRVRRRFELLDLLAPYSYFLPDPPDPADSRFHAMFGKISLEPFRPKGLAGSFVSGEVRVAVGTPVAQRPPHRPVRAALPHTVLASGNNADTDGRIRMADTGEWEPPVRETFHPVPDQPVFMASPFQGFPAQPADLLAEPRYGGCIHRYSIIADVPSYDGPQVNPLLRNRIVHAMLQFLVDFSELRLPPRAHRLAKDDKFPFPGSSTDVGKPQEVECLRLPFSATAQVFSRKPAKFQQTCLVRMERQLESPEPFGGPKGTFFTAFTCWNGREGQP